GPGQEGDGAESLRKRGRSGRPDEEPPQRKDGGSAARGSGVTQGRYDEEGIRRPGAVGELRCRSDQRRVPRESAPEVGRSQGSGGDRDGRGAGRAGEGRAGCPAGAGEDSAVGARSRDGPQGPDTGVSGAAIEHRAAREDEELAVRKGGRGR